ncbi:glutathione peroxidase [Methylomonas sp. AM2-LC]|uniref:glutathione peroxidase n=1 Tax=Methylomonas sp. AM2-LC TaxID=3153301 RepID=UPI003263D405
MHSIYAFTVKTADGQALPLEKYRGQVLLMVNTASHCGFTPQYQGLETLYQNYQKDGFVILGFPCNQFGQQEPGDNAGIVSFCQKNYGVSFPVLAKIDVNGKQADPLFTYLKTAAPGILATEAIKWNFTKFLIDREGKVYKRYGSLITPARIKTDIEYLLGSA